VKLLVCRTGAFFRGCKRGKERKRRATAKVALAKLLSQGTLHKSYKQRQTQQYKTIHCSLLSVLLYIQCNRKRGEEFHSFGAYDEKALSHLKRSRVLGTARRLH